MRLNNMWGITVTKFNVVETTLLLHYGFLESCSIVPKV